MSILDQLTNKVKPDELGLAVTQGSYSLVLDCPEVQVFGMPMDATIFNARPEALVDWVKSGEGGGVYYCWLNAPLGIQKLQPVLRQASSQTSFEQNVFIVRDEPRIRIVAENGTPEDDPITFMRFIYAYRDYILKAVEGTNICPRLLAAVVYCDYLRSESRESSSQTRFSRERNLLNGKLVKFTSSPPPQLDRLDYWDIQLGICDIPIFLVAVTRMNLLPQTLAAVARDSNGTWVLSDDAENKLILTSNIAGWSLPSDIGDYVNWANLARFPKSNISYTAKILDGLSKYDVGASLQRDRGTLVGGWRPNQVITDESVVNAEEDLFYLLAAFDRLRSLGSLRKVGYRQFAQQVLDRSQLPVMDLFFNVQDDYGGYVLRQGDSDDTAAPFEPTYGGVRRTVAVATLHIERLVGDLRHIGFPTAGFDVQGAINNQNLVNAPGQFRAPIDWAVREFQTHAGMERLASVDAAHDAWPANDQLDYEVHLRSVDPNPIRYIGPVSGNVNIETRALLQYWKRNHYRCPLVLSARRELVAHSDIWDVWNGAGINRANLWHRRDVSNTTPRMFARDFTGYYETFRTVSRYPPPRADSRIVAGTFTNAIHGGEVVFKGAHAWPEAKIMWGMLTDQPVSNAGATASTMRAVLSVGLAEAQEHFDVVNAYDNGFVSIGLCHWILGLRNQRSDGTFELRPGELNGLLSLYKERYPEEFNILFRRYGVDVKAWGTDGNSLADPSVRVFNGWVERIDELDRPAILRWAGSPAASVLQFDFQRSWRDTSRTQPREHWDNLEAFEYFRTWPFFYRFVMAGRAGKGLRRIQWDMARIRIRDLRNIIWLHNTTDPDFLNITDRDPVTGNSRLRQATLGDIFTSEKSMALLYRWHVNWPTTLLGSDVGRPEADMHLKAAFRAVRDDPANAAIFYNGVNLRRDVSTWIINDENILVQGMLNYIRNQVVGSAAFPDTDVGNTNLCRPFNAVNPANSGAPEGSWKNLFCSMRSVANWAGHTDEVFFLNPLSTARNSFSLDMAGLPPIPPKFVP